MRRRIRPEDGFSLVETLAALLVFTIVTLGVVPLMLSSMTGGNLTRSFTIGKTLVQRAMEQVRGLPYYVAAGTPAKRVDLLDFYFPFGSNGGGTNYAAATYTTTCTPAISGNGSNPSCPLVLPTAYDVTYTAQFVTPSGTTPETYSVVEPAATYAWNSATTDLAPSQLLRMTITAAWSLGGRPRSFALTSVIGDRQVPSDKVRGVARVNYAVQVVGSYVDTVSGKTSDLLTIAGTAESRIETRLQAQADQSVSGGVMRLTEPAVEPTPAVVLDSLSGATSNLHAPPDSPTAPGASAAADDIVHPDPLIGTVAHLDRSLTTGITTSTLKVVAEGGLPLAEGEFTLNPAPLAAFDLWVNNRAETGEGTTLWLSPNDLGTTPVFSVIPLGSNTTEGSSQAVTEDTGSVSRRVETIATVRVGQINLFPVVYRAGQPVVIIKDFTATTRCNSTASASTAVADASYSATLQYFAETDPDDGVPEGSLVTLAPLAPPGLSSAKTSDPLAALATENPMVREDPLNAAAEGSPRDIYLFPVTHGPTTVAPGHTSAHVEEHKHPGYIQSWDSKYADTIFESSADAGRVTGARVDGAINITTVRSHPQRPETRLVISIGNLACEAVDRR